MVSRLRGHQTDRTGALRRGDPCVKGLTLSKHIEAKPAELDAVALIAADSRAMTRFTAAVDQTRIKPSAWGDQEQLVAAARTWQQEFQQAGTTMTDGLKATRQLIEEAADAYRVQDAADAARLRALNRRLNRGAR